MMRPQPIAAGNYAWDEVPVEKIISSEVAGFLSMKEEGTQELSARKPCAII